MTDFVVALLLFINSYFGTEVCNIAKVQTDMVVGDLVGCQQRPVGTIAQGLVVGFNDEGFMLVSGDTRYIVGREISPGCHGYPVVPDITAWSPGECEHIETRTLESYILPCDK